MARRAPVFPSIKKRHRPTRKILPDTAPPTPPVIPPTIPLSAIRIGESLSVTFSRNLTVGVLTPADWLIVFELGMLGSYMDAPAAEANTETVELSWFFLNAGSATPLGLTYTGTNLLDDLGRTVAPFAGFATT